MNINGVHVFGVKDSTGNVQGIHAIQTSNIVYTIDNNLLTQIQSTEYTLQFNYNDTTSQYYVMVLSSNNSYQIPSLYTTSNVNLPQFDFDLSMDANISDPCTGIIIELKDSVSQQLIRDATMHLNYHDDQYQCWTILCSITN